MPSSKSYSPERHYQNMAKPEGSDQLLMSPKSKDMYTKEMALFWEPSASVENDSKIGCYADTGSVNGNHFFNRCPDAKSKEVDCLSEPEAVFQSVLPRMASDPKAYSWLDTFSTSMSTSSSKSISEDFAEYRQYLSSSNMNSQWKIEFPYDGSNRWDPNSSGSNHRRRPYSNSNQNDQLDDTFFELIKAQCLSNPWLMEKVVNWGANHSQFTRIAQEDVLKLSSGRLWVTVRSLKPSEETEIKSLQNELDDIKGAYQEVEQGVYKQPKPEGREAEIQHRLLRDSVGFWLIEKYDSAGDDWFPVARQQGDGRWLDYSHNRPIQVVLIPMRKILSRLRDEGCLYQDVAKSVEFLFTSCDQKKLNGKLKTRTLKHNIANLRNKLDKQYALSFAILVANAADKITNEA